MTDGLHRQPEQPEHEVRSEGSAQHAAANVQRDKRPFAKTAQSITHAVGTAWAVAGVVTLFVAWFMLGLTNDFPRWWEISATAGLPFLSLLMLVIIQHTQNHEARAMNLKLDELIRAQHPAEDSMMTIEDAGTEQLDDLQSGFRQQAKHSD